MSRPCSGLIRERTCAKVAATSSSRDGGRSPVYRCTIVTKDCVSATRNSPTNSSRSHGTRPFQCCPRARRAMSATLKRSSAARRISAPPLFPSVEANPRRPQAHEPARDRPRHDLERSDGSAGHGRGGVTRHGLVSDALADHREQKHEDHGGIARPCLQLLRRIATGARYSDTDRTLPRAHTRSLVKIAQPTAAEPQGSWARRSVVSDGRGGSGAVHRWRLPLTRRWAVSLTSH